MKKTKMKIIKVPEHLWDDFLMFLNVSQAEFTEEQISTFTKNEKDTLKFIKNLLEENVKGGPSKRIKIRGQYE